MPKHTATLLVLAAFAGQACAHESVRTGYGAVTAVPPANNASGFSIRFKGASIASVSGEQVSLYKVAGADPTQYVVVEAWRPALNCHYEYVLLKLSAGGAAQHSKPFGNCYQLKSAKRFRGAVQVRLTSAATPTVGATFRWAGGTINQVGGKENGR
ncbi:hypothetical protein [Cognatilysobacter lacus]|uniref:Uncharacterized protein n=1 Tax=Cognatilysobacter lacus TaxID=1643323 RepID=A0A5D8YG17_9GAMM|nr:hypothetical protein [Lysobacter lacus]TZF80712.1 hypothetical protein FW784_13860 [Lysobacter lacus]